METQTGGSNFHDSTASLYAQMMFSSNLDSGVIVVRQLSEQHSIQAQTTMQPQTMGLFVVMS